MSRKRRKRKSKPEVSASASASGNHGTESRPPGGQGAILTDPHHTRGDMVMLRMAARRKWPISRAQRKKSCARLERIIDECTDDDTVISAIKTQGVLDSINARREANAVESEKEGGQININLGVAIAPLRQELLGNASHLDQCGDDPEDGDAGEVRGNRESRAMDNGSAPPKAKPGHNGHHNGNGRY